MGLAPLGGRDPDADGVVLAAATATGVVLGPRFATAAAWVAAACCLVVACLAAAGPSRVRDDAGGNPSIAGETAGLAGWLAWDLEDRRAAGAYFRAGIEAAQEAEDRPLGAYLVGSSCVQPAYRERPHACLRRLQGRTSGFATADANPTTRAWLVTLEAEAHALAGSEAASLRTLDQAERIMEEADQEDASRRPRATFFSGAYLVGERGVALARLGRSADAQHVLEAALESLDPEMIKTRPRLLTALATSHAHEGNIDQACRLGSDALELAERQQVTTNLQDVRRLRLDLEPWRDAAAVRELDEQLAAANRT